MASSTPGDNDPYLAELRRLAAKTALPSNLEESTALLSLLPDSLIPATRPIPDRARVLLRVFREVIGRAFTALRADHNDLYAGRVLAAGAVIGLITEPPDKDYQRSPAEMPNRGPAHLKTLRQGIAAKWLVPPVGDARAFRSPGREDACLDAFRHALLDFLEAEQAVRALAQRLGTGPIAAHEEPTEPAAEPEAAQPTASWFAAHRKQLVMGAAALLVLLGLGLGLGLGLPSASPAGSNGPSASGPGGSGSQAVGLPSGHKAYQEQEGHIGEQWTYTNPLDPADTGPGVSPLQKVRVSCKVYAPTMGSVSPAGYWYRLASAPYDNKDYGIANTYLNGDPVVGTSNAPQINVDRKVPDCPR
jgi:hypothetical protein